MAPEPSLPEAHTTCCAAAARAQPNKNTCNPIHHTVTFADLRQFCRHGPSHNAITCHHIRKSTADAGALRLSSRKLGEPVAKQRPCEPYYPGPRANAQTVEAATLGPGQ
jgi:hypothetical protein